MIRKALTENGWVEGLPAADPRITAFRGIPFAAPPVGDLRWRSPQPASDWDGVLKAYNFGPISMQDTPGLGTDIYCREWHVDPAIPMDEDCLYLNVWTNAKSENDKKPVLVWFFGGGLQWGYTAEMEFNGERIARRDVVVVSVNYRLGCFGFIAHPEITKENPEAPSNFGNQDQRAGLLWVKKNIKAFGGDPDNITIAGQSAGGGSVLSQMASPMSKGLFNKAIVMSGMFESLNGEKNIGEPEPLEKAQKKGQDFFEFLGVSNLNEARKIDAVTLRNKYSEYAATHPRMFTVKDGGFTVGTPLDIVREGKGANVPLMCGNTSDEFLTEIDGCKVSGIEKACKKVANSWHDKGLSPVYYYLFDADIPGEDNPGTFHSVDLWFWFETLASCSRPYVGRHYDLARKMCNYLTNFVKNGNPNGQDSDGTDMDLWTPYSDANPFTMKMETK